MNKPNAVAKYQKGIRICQPGRLKGKGDLLSVLIA
jgi:hypothetical protein